MTSLNASTAMNSSSSSTTSSVQQGGIVQASSACTVNGGIADVNPVVPLASDLANRHCKRMLDRDSIMYRYLESKKRLKTVKQQNNALLERTTMDPFESVTDIVKFATAFHVYDDPVAGEGDSDNCRQADAAFEKVSQKLVDRCDRFVKLHRASLFRVALSSNTLTQETLIDKLYSTHQQESLKEDTALLVSKTAELNKRKIEERKRIAEEKMKASLSSQSLNGDLTDAAEDRVNDFDGHGDNRGIASVQEQNPYAQITAGANPLVGLLGGGSSSTAGTISMSDVVGTSPSLLLP